MGDWFPTHPDPRSDAYLLMHSWLPTAMISLAYVIGVYAWRSELKRNCREKSSKYLANSGRPSVKPAFKWDLVTCLMVAYNTGMVIYSAYMCIGCLLAVRALGYGLGCEAQPDPRDTSTDVLFHLGYHFYFSKFVEMLDTVFFLWRGRVDQVTFLHVFHHFAMPVSIWPGVRYAPGGIVYTFLLLNSFVHVIMYAYYGMAAAGLYKYLWWKNYLTQLQMLQFVLLILHQGQIFVRSTPCNYPKVFPAAIVMYASIFLVLFGNFYVKAYWKKQRLVKLRVHKSKVSVVLEGDQVGGGKAISPRVPSTVFNGDVANGSCTRSKVEESGVQRRK